MSNAPPPPPSTCSDVSTANDLTQFTHKFSIDSEKPTLSPSSLPLEIVLRILESLSISDLLPCRPVSPLFGEIVDDILRRRCKQFCIDSKLAEETRIPIRRVMRIVGPWVHALHIKTLERRYRSNTGPNVKRPAHKPQKSGTTSSMVVNSCPNLEHLKFSNGYFDPPSEFAGVPDLSNLITLDFQTTSFDETHMSLLLGACSDKLRKLTFEYVSTSGMCLEKAPKKITCAAFIDVYYIIPSTINKFVTDNPQLTDFTYVNCSQKEIDLQLWCNILPCVTRLHILCRSLNNYKALALCTNLKTLEITVCSNFFSEFAEKLEPDNSIEEMVLEFTEFRLSDALIECFKCFTNLKRLTLHLPEGTTQSYRILPHLTGLKRLETLHMAGEPCDHRLSHFRPLFKHPALRHIRVHLHAVQLAELCQWTSLETLELHVMDDETEREIVEKEVNHFLLALAKVNKVRSFAIQTEFLMPLHQETLDAMARFDVEKLTVFDTFGADEILSLIGQLRCLETFTHKSAGRDIREREREIKSVRPNVICTINTEWDHM